MHMGERGEWIRRARGRPWIRAFIKGSGNLPRALKGQLDHLSYIGTKASMCAHTQTQTQTQTDTDTQTDTNTETHTDRHRHRQTQTQTQTTNTTPLGMRPAPSMVPKTMQRVMALKRRGGIYPPAAKVPSFCWRERREREKDRKRERENDREMDKERSEEHT